MLNIYIYIYKTNNETTFVYTIMVLYEQRIQCVTFSKSVLVYYLLFIIDSQSNSVIIIVIR